MAVDKSELRTEFARLPSRHAPADPEGLGFVRSGKHDPAADGDRLAAQRRVEQLLDRGVEGIQVCMEDGGYQTKVRFKRQPCYARSSSDVSEGSAMWLPPLALSPVRCDAMLRAASGAKLTCHGGHGHR